MLDFDHARTCPFSTINSGEQSLLPLPLKMAVTDAIGLVAIFPNLHVLEANTDLHCLPYAIKNVVLHIGHAMLFAHSLDLGGYPLIRQHAHVRPHLHPGRKPRDQSGHGFFLKHA